MRQRLSEAEKASLDERRAAAGRATEKFREKLRFAAFGKSSLFGTDISNQHAAPVAAGAVVVEGFGDGVPSGSATSVWSFLSRACGAQGGPAVPVGGLFSLPASSAPGVVLQVLLRIPAFAMWLHLHMQSCAGSSSCLACALWRCRVACGAGGWHGALPDGMWRCRVACGDVGWHVALLHGMWRCQVACGVV